VKADVVCMAKAIGGGLPLGAFGARKELMDEIGSFRSFHAGAYASNPLATTACVTALEQVLVPAVYEKTTALGNALADGHNQILKRHGLPFCAVNQARAAPCTGGARRPRTTTSGWTRTSTPSGATGT
jgi:glutamate-1-semialdehyde 2,1-aminomutase